MSNVITDESLNNTITEETICNYNSFLIYLLIIAKVNVFYFYSGVHASYPLMDFEESICSNPLQIDYKKLKLFFQKCPNSFEVSKI